jgi:glycerol uptake facilitator-like aquaporin
VRDPRTLFLVLLGACVVATYVLHVRPKARRQWLLVALTIAFLAWLLPLMVTVRSGSLIPNP